MTSRSNFGKMRSFFNDFIFHELINPYPELIPITTGEDKA